MSWKLTFSGVIPANLLPFTPEYAIAEAEYRRHLSWLADVPGTTAITVNGLALPLLEESHSYKAQGGIDVLDAAATSPSSCGHPGTDRCRSGAPSADQARARR